MIRLLGPIHNINAVACSGGVDGMAALHFIQQVNPKIKVVHFNHNTEHGQKATDFVTDYCTNNNLELIYAELTVEKNPKDSQEEFWRKERYKFFHGLSDLTIASAHHLNDVAETWLFGAIHGQTKLIPYRNKNVVRPFLLTSKAELISWCERKEVPWIEDDSNKNTRFSRNRVRHNILPEVFEVNPGFLKVISKKLLQENNGL